MPANDSASTHQHASQRRHDRGELVEVESAQAEFWAVLFDTSPSEIRHAIGLVGNRPDVVERYVKGFGQHACVH